MIEDGGRGRICICVVLAALLLTLLLPAALCFDVPSLLLVSISAIFCQPN